MLQLAIERQFEIIGEALYRLARIEESNLGCQIPEYRKIIDFKKFSPTFTFTISLMKPQFGISLKTKFLFCCKRLKIIIRHKSIGLQNDIYQLIFFSIATTSANLFKKNNSKTGWF